MSICERVCITICIFLVCGVYAPPRVLCMCMFVGEIYIKILIRTFLQNNLTKKTRAFDKAFNDTFVIHKFILPCDVPSMPTASLLVGYFANSSNTTVLLIYFELPHKNIVITTLDDSTRTKQSKRHKIYCSPSPLLLQRCLRPRDNPALNK